MTSNAIVNVPAPAAPGSGIAPTVSGISTNFTAGNVHVLDLAITGGVTSGNMVVIGIFAFAAPDQGALTAAMLTKSSGAATIGAVQLDVSTSRVDGANKNYAAVYSVPVTGTGALTLNFDMVAGSDFISMCGCEVQLVDVSASRVNATSSANASTDVNIASGNVATGGAGIIFGVTAPGNPYGTITLTEDGAFSLVGETEDDSQNNGALIYRASSSDITDSADWTAGTSCAWCAGAVAYKAATP